METYEGNRLHHDQCKAQKHGKNSTKQYIRHGNRNQNQQRRVHTMQLYYTAAKKYKKPIPADNGARLKYDIKELRPHPEKLTKSLQEHQQETNERQEIKHDWGEWEGYQKTLGGLLEKTYPLRKKETMAKEPDWTLKLEEWGAEKEIEDLEYARKKEAPYNKKEQEENKKWAANTDIIDN